MNLPIRLGLVLALVVLLAPAAWAQREVQDREMWNVARKFRAVQAELTRTNEQALVQEKAAWADIDSVEAELAMLKPDTPAYRRKMAEAKKLTARAYEIRIGWVQKNLGRSNELMKLAREGDAVWQRLQSGLTPEANEARTAAVSAFVDLGTSIASVALVTFGMTNLPMREEVQALIEQIELTKEWTGQGALPMTDLTLLLDRMAHLSSDMLARYTALRDDALQAGGMLELAITYENFQLLEEDLRRTYEETKNLLGPGTGPRSLTGNAIRHLQRATKGGGAPASSASSAASLLQRIEKLRTGGR